MSKLIPAQRRDEIRQYLKNNQYAGLIELSEKLNVSESTIRRDLDKLEKDGVLERTHGGALLSQKMSEEPIFSNSQLAFPEEKQRIGLAASKLVESGDSIFMSNGTTIAQVARFINSRTALSDITIITNNISAALEVKSPDIKVILTGGLINQSASATGGRFAVNVINQIYADKAIIGADGLSFKYGCTSPLETEAEISQLMIEHTYGKVILVADHSKWGVVGKYHVAPLDAFHVYITDPGIPEVDLVSLYDRNLKIIVCKED